MPFPLFLFVLLAPSVSPSTPITVTAHPWAPFISPMGEPFRAHNASDDTLADWFRQADTNHDGILTAAEMQADAERFFAKLDTDHDGEIGPEEIANYEYEVAPEIQVMSRTRRAPGEVAAAKLPDDPYDDTRKQRRRRDDQAYESLGLGGALQGAARYALLNIPEPVAAADADFNRGVSRQEFRDAALARFELLDTAHRGSITLAQLEAMPHAPSGNERRRKVDPSAVDARIGNPLPSGP